MASDLDARAVAAAAFGLECHIDRGTIAQALATVAFGVARRPVVATLGGVLLDATDDDVTVTTTDCDTVVSVRLPGVVACTPGRLLLDHAELAKVIGALVKGTRKREADATPVTIRTIADGTGVVDMAGYTIPVTTYPAQDFPELPAMPPTIAEVDRERFAAEARRALIACSSATVPPLQGVRIQTSGDALTLAGTDSHRLAVAEMGAAITTDAAVTIPDGVLSTTLKHCAGDTVRLGTDSARDQVALSCGALTVMTRSVDYPFPKWERLFPQPVATVHADRDAMVTATSRAAAVAAAKKHTRDNDKGGLLAVTLDAAGWTSVAPVLTDHAEEVTAPQHPAEVDGIDGSMRVLFRADLLRDALDTFDDDILTLHLTSASHPVLMTAEGTPGYRHLLMPTRAPKN